MFTSDPAIGPSIHFLSLQRGLDPITSGTGRKMGRTVEITQGIWHRMTDNYTHSHSHKECRVEKQTCVFRTFKAGAHGAILFHSRQTITKHRDVFSHGSETVVRHCERASEMAVVLVKDFPVPNSDCVGNLGWPSLTLTSATTHVS